MASIQLRTLIDNVLQDTSRDMREQADAVDVAFQKRVDEVQDAKNKLEENLKKVGTQKHEIVPVGNFKVQSCELTYSETCSERPT